MSLSASEHILKRFHGYPRAHVSHLNIFSTGTWPEPRCVTLVYSTRCIECHEVTVFCVMDYGGDKIKLAHI